MKRFRCYKCNPPRGVEFASDKPYCPSCKMDGGQLILELVNVHWHAPRKGDPTFGHDIACMPQRPTVAGLSVSGEMTSVTCPKCRESEVFQKSWAEWANAWPDLANAWKASQCPTV